MKLLSRTKFLLKGIELFFKNLLSLRRISSRYELWRWRFNNWKLDRARRRTQRAHEVAQDSSDDTYGYYTSAKPNYKVQQDPELIETVYKMLKSNNTCPHCGGQMRGKNGLVLHRS